jgi:hypothetical protein
MVPDCKIASGKSKVGHGKRPNAKDFCSRAAGFSASAAAGFFVLVF